VRLLLKTACHVGSFSVHPRSRAVARLVAITTGEGGELGRPRDLPASQLPTHREESGIQSSGARLIGRIVELATVSTGSRLCTSALTQFVSGQVAALDPKPGSARRPLDVGPRRRARDDLLRAGWAGGPGNAQPGLFREPR